MAAISRREFFKQAGADAAVAGFLVSGAAVALKANPLGLPIGSQTYPHRAMISEGNFPGLLKTLADIGVQRIELCSALGYKEFASLADGKQVRKIIADHGLQCESAHFSMRELRETQEKSIAWAKDIGITQMITATLGAGNTPTMDDVKKAADEYNTIAAVAAKAGIVQGLHNEGFELSEVEGSEPTTFCSTCSIRSSSSSSSRCPRSAVASSPPSTSRSTRAASFLCTSRTST